MLEYKDLMIGDWIMADGVPAQILSLGSKGAIITGGLDKACHYDNMQPIPLTPEILWKNGMSRNPYGEYFAEDKHCFLEISCEPEGFFWTINANEYSIIPLNYVHELQHALRLCGIDKEIVL